MKLKAKTSESCGDSTFSAAKSDAPMRRNLDETGLQVCSCRHSIIKQAVNMHHGESYRHTSFLEVYLRKRQYEFICGDVMCRYKVFAEKVKTLQNDKGEYLFPELMGSKYFLGRMHAHAHVWYCPVSNI